LGASETGRRLRNFPTVSRGTERLRIYANTLSRRGPDRLSVNTHHTIPRIEHWDVLQIVGTPMSAADWYAPNMRAANENGMF
jgi:hypothetical protein